MKSLRLGHIALLIALALLLWILQRALGPAVVLLATWILLWPLRREPGGRPLQAVLYLGIALWIFHEARWVVYPLIGGVLLAYILAPIVAWLQRKHIVRPLAALLSLLPLVFLAGLVLLLLVPALLEQISLVVQKLPDIYSLVNQRIGPWLNRLGAHPPALPPGGEVPGPVPVPSTPAIPPWLQQLMSHGEALLRAAIGTLSGVGRSLGKVIQWLGVLLLAPVSAYYLLVDWERLGPGVLGWLPSRWHGAVRRLSGDVQLAFRVYVRGVALVAMVEAVLYSIAFLIAGVPRAIALGVLTGMLSFIPILGFWTSALLVSLSALTGPEPWGTLLKGAIGLLAINTLEGQVLVPRIQGSGLGLHPLAVLFGVLIFGALFGIPGVLLAVPVMGALRASLPDLRGIWTKSGYFKGTSSTEEGD